MLYAEFRYFILHAELVRIGKYADQNAYQIFARNKE